MDNLPNWFNTYILPLLPTVATIAGWLVLSKQEQHKRANELKSKRIDLALKLADEIEENALRYYTLSYSEGKQMEKSMVFDLKRLAAYCNRINDDLSLEVMDFRIAVSGGDFQSAQRQPLPLDAPLFMRIRNKSFTLKTKLDYYHDH